MKVKVIASTLAVFPLAGMGGTPSGSGDFYRKHLAPAVDFNVYCGSGTTSEGFFTD